MTRYQITCNGAQLRLISDACELLARLHMHQFSTISHIIWPEDIRMSREYWDYLDGIKEFMGPIQDKSPRRCLWDIHQVLRHRLAYDANPGVTPENRWPHHWGVNFDEPMRTDEENELIEVRKIE